MNITELNSLDRHEAVSTLTGCCASTAWIDRMVAARPFRDAPAILTAAEEVWWDLGADDWQEAFTAHQGMPSSDTTGEYEEEFGYPYLVFAENLSKDALNAVYQRRLEHDALTELTISATEQARIANFRLRQLLDLA
jgi:2-oxo-4-hydroxy-4-carboxy-5-ureidoimidazoline decarboxylase